MKVIIALVLLLGVVFVCTVYYLATVIHSGDLAAVLVGAVAAYLAIRITEGGHHQ